MSPITNIGEFQQNIRSCIELRILRSKLSYYHHLFVGDVDTDGCDLYHYKGKSSLPFVSFPPAQITKVRLQYVTYDSCSEILSIFNFYKGDTVEIVDRSDYPTTEEERNKCIERAKARIGEIQYTLSFNNCESFVNWIFSNDSSSNQATESWRTYFLTLSLDELRLTNVLSCVLQDVPVIFPEIRRMIKEMCEKIATCVNLEKYWNKFLESIDEIADQILEQLTNPGPIQSIVRNAGQWLKKHPFIAVDAIINVIKILAIANATFLREDQKSQAICRTVFSFVGELVGKGVCQLPGVGGYIGNVAGAIVGDVVYFGTCHVIPSSIQIPSLSFAESLVPLLFS